MLLFRLYEKVTKKQTKGYGPLDSRGAVQSSARMCFWKNLKQFVSKTVFRL